MPCEKTFQQMAADEPKELVAWILSGELGGPDLSFAAEALGSVEDAALVVPALLEVLTHPSAPTREGAVYGLGPHAERSLEARAALEQVAAHDPSPGVREAAADAQP